MLLIGGKKKILKNSKIMQINSSFAELRLKPNLESNLETEALFGESFEVIKSIEQWSYGRLLTDNYYGWINNKCLINPSKRDYIVKSPRANINIKPNIKSSIILTLSLGSKINAKKYNDEWFEIFLSDNTKFKNGFISNLQITAVNSSTNDWVSNAEKLIYTPYKWGGRSAFGIDCSALVQISMLNFFPFFPRNTGDQITSHYLKNININKIKRGCLIFWKGHVAIALNCSLIIHANNYHKAVYSESLEKAIERNLNNNLSVLAIKEIIT